MAFIYSQELLDAAFTYAGYRNHLANVLALPATNEAAEKMRPYVEKNIALMNGFDATYKISDTLKAAVVAAPATTWLVLTEGWCGDAAFSVPLFAALEKGVPEKVQLRILLRDDNLNVMDAHLTDGGRSIPKLIVLNNDLKEVGTWGPQPAPLRTLMKTWKGEGLVLKELIPKVADWYKHDETVSVQEELENLVKAYS